MLFQAHDEYDPESSKGRGQNLEGDAPAILLVLCNYFRRLQGLQKVLLPQITLIFAISCTKAVEYWENKGEKPNLL